MGEIMIGRTILHYKILEKLGEGGMGVVYKAEDTKLKRDVAIKFLPHFISTDNEEIKRFEVEAQAAASLNHPNIAQIFSIEEVKNTLGEPEIFMVMEYIEGKDLKKRLKENSISTDEAVKIAAQIVEGLEAAHKKGIIHRDIKSQNIMITKAGNVKILDFGLAKISGRSQLTKAGSTVGTIAYMSPEQATGEDIDNRTDIWAFGVVLYELLTDHQPFEAQYEQAIIYSILNEPPTPVEKYKENCPAFLVKIVNKCLVKNREERYQKISEVNNDLQSAELDTDYSLKTKTLEIKKQDHNKLNLRKISTIVGVLIVIFALLVLVPDVGQNFKDIIGWNPVPKEQHLVILPLVNIGGNANSQAFCDGLLETLSSNITQIEQFRKSLWVVPASEVIQNNIKSVSEAYKRYGVNLAVTGSVQFIDKILKLNINLVDAKDLRQLNSSIINVNTKDISSIDNKAVIKLMEMIHVEMEPQLKDVLEAGKTNDPDAYEYYVQGIGKLQQYQSSGNLEESIRLLKLAVQSDSNYALAYAGLGEAYWLNYELTRKSSLVELAEKAANKGFALDSSIASTNITLGIINNGRGRYDYAVFHFKKALASEPSDAAAYRGLAKAYQSLNKNMEAEATYKQAIQLKPDYWAGYNDLGVYYYYQGRYNEAVEQFKQVIQYTPNNYRGYVNLGAMYYSLDRLKDAQDMFEKSINAEPNYSAYSNLGVLYYKENNFDKSVKMYEQALKINDNDYIMWANLATALSFIPNRRKEKIETEWKAISLLEQELKINPNNPDYISDLAAYYSDLSDSAKSFALLEKALKIAPNNLNVMYRAATINENFNNRDKAIFWIKKAIDNGYSRSEIEQEPSLKDLVNDKRYKQLFIDKKNK